MNLINYINFMNGLSWANWVDCINLANLMNFEKLFNCMNWVILIGVNWMISGQEQHKTNSQIRDTLLCQSRTKVNVVKWCQKRCI